MRRRELEAMHNERKVLNEALAVYADPTNWSLEDGRWVSNTDMSPNVARKALGMDDLDESNHGKAMKAAKTVKPGKNQWKKPD